MTVSVRCQLHDGSDMYRKRERTQNWTLEEKKYLLELVKSRLDVLENKRIDSASSALKGMAWQDIHASFAARFGSDRDAHRVREQWRRMKGQSRTEMLEFADRVRTYGAAVANQRWPAPLAEEVWKTLEAARNINGANQSYGAGEDAVSPVTMDDEEEDGDDVLFDGDGGNRNRRRDMDFSLLNNGIKTEPPDFADGADDCFEQSRSFARIDRDHGDPLEFRDFRDHDVSIVGEEIGAAGLMSMLRPKVEINDVPDLDTSMVPSGLSITAVKVEDSGQNKRRLVERQELPIKIDSSPCWDSGHDRHDGAGRAGPAPPPRPPGPPGPPAVSPARGLLSASSAAPPPRMYGQGLSGANHLPPSVQESKRLEQRRRLQMLEEEHRAKMELLRVEKATAEIRRRIALSDEANATRALTCRSCGADRAVESFVTAKRRPSDAKSDARDVADLDLDNDRGANDASVASTESTPNPDDASRGSGEHVNGIKDIDQVRFAGGLGEPGSGAGKGGGAGGSIREAGGSMGKREAAFEDEYFYKQQKEQLKKLKSDLADEIGFHEEQIKRHQEAISRHKQRVNDLDKDK